RALEPTIGRETMAKRRGTDEPRLLAAGPGRLTQALGLTGEHDGLPLDQPPFALYAAGEVTIAVGPRIGITKAAEVPWRYVEAGSPYLSRPIRPRQRSCPASPAPRRRPPAAAGRSRDRAAPCPSAPR